jgi:hypothetical protein
MKPYLYQNLRKFLIFNCFHMEKHFKNSAPIRKIRPKFSSQIFPAISILVRPCLSCAAEESASWGHCMWLPQSSWA